MRQDKDLYSKILGVQSPWKVDPGDLDLKKGEVNVHLAHDIEARWPCPECGTLYPLYDHQAEPRWRHLDTCQLRTVLHGLNPAVASPPYSKD